MTHTPMDETRVILPMKSKRCEMDCHRKSEQSGAWYSSGAMRHISGRQAGSAQGGRGDLSPERFSGVAACVCGCPFLDPFWTGSKGRSTGQPKPFLGSDS